MANLPAAFPKFNLVKNNTDRVSVSVWLPRGNEAAEGIAASIGSRQTKVQIAQYRRSKTEHYVTQFFLLQPDETDEYVMVDVKYDLEPSPFHASQRFAEKALAPFLEELLDAQPSMVHRNISMFFDSEDDFEGLFFPLPVAYPDDDSEPWPLDELRGIRGVKLKNRDAEAIEDFSFILDRPFNNRLYLTVHFLNETRLPASPILDTMTRGRLIATSMGIIGRR